MLRFDSRKVENGDSFYAFDSITGGKGGQAFITQALEKGAKRIICKDNEQTRKIKRLNKTVEFVFEENVQKRFALDMASYYDYPQKSLKLIGVTGTDGKTSTCCFLYQLLKLNNKKVGLLSTAYLDDGDGLISSPYRQSTPEADILYSFLSRCEKNQLEYVILEATSHALSEKNCRLYGLEFEMSIYTSLSSEHLEFHKTLANYIDSKLNLARYTKGLVLYPSDGFYNDKIIKSTSAKTASYHDLEAKQSLDYSLILNKYHFCYGQKEYIKNLNATLIGVSFLLNKEINYSLIEKIKPIIGRFKIIKSPNRGQIIIDFAHTVDSFYKLLSFIKETKPGKKITLVFSCAGNRDTSKRSQMGKIASEFATTIILTSEDPRKEDQKKINQDIKSLYVRETVTYEIEDRYLAIKKAIALADENTITLLLGKGHERSIEYKDITISWDEEKALNKALTSFSAIIYGGVSPEHEVSINSKNGVLEELKRNEPNLYQIKIEKNGDWKIEDQKLVLKEGVGLFFENGKKLEIETAYLLVHGTNCEDGKLQKTLEDLGIKYTGCEVECSELCMQKTPTREKVRDLVPIIKGTDASKIDYQGFKFPLLVKPEDSGSSVGITVINDEKELKNAMEYALKFGSSALVEELIYPNKELECGIYAFDGKVTALPVAQLMHTSAFLSYDQKYNQGANYIVCPAPIDENLSKQIQEIAIKIFKRLGCRSYARVDFLFDERTNTLYFNEINTLPGMTKTSHYPSMLRAAGINLEDFLLALKIEAQNGASFFSC